jgi:hypothetical protein
LAAELNDRRITPADITGEVIRAFVPEGAKVDQQRDHRLQYLAEKLAEAYSVQAAPCHLMMSDSDWDFMELYFRAIDEICHTFMYFHPPKMEGIPLADFEMYQHVVSGAYRAHDMMLQRLIHLAGPDTAMMLLSDDEFHSDHLRPKFTPRLKSSSTGSMLYAPSLYIFSDNDVAPKSEISQGIGSSIVLGSLSQQGVRGVTLIGVTLPPTSPLPRLELKRLEGAWQISLPTLVGRSY